MFINLSCTKAENAHLFLNQMINYKSLQTYTKEWCTGLLGPPLPQMSVPPEWISTLWGGPSGPPTFWIDLLTKEVWEDRGREGPSSGPKAGVLCSPLDGQAASSQSSPPLLSPSNHLSWANAMSMLLFLIYLFPTPTHMSFYLGEKGYFKENLRHFHS